MITLLLPPQVSTCATTRDLLTAAPIPPVEEAQIARAVPQRRFEYLTARWCARQALSRLGHHDVALPKNAHGAIDWPEGITGSLTHCAGFRAAAVARLSDVKYLGIDAEPNFSLPSGVLEVISSVWERNHIALLLETHPGVHWDRLLFSAKESVYKAWYPVTLCQLGFSDAELEFQLDGSFAATLTAKSHTPWALMEGRWRASRDLLTTAVCSLA